MRQTARTRAAALPLALALALILLAGGVLAAPAASVAAQGRLLTATDTPAVTDTPSDTPTATDTPAATNTPAPTATATTAPTPTATLPPNPYNLDLRAAAAEAAWPQQFSNWCGVATVALIADYVNPGSGVSQQGVLNALNDPTNASQWGYPTPGGWGPYVPSDIARDFGTDPRSLAEGLTLATGRQYHVIVDTHGAWDTTVHIVHDLLVSKQPVSVFVDHGQHSIVVSGVDATANPLTNPKAITAIHVWDPGGGVNFVGIQPHIAMTVPINMWLSGVIPWSGSDYFKYPYSDNVYQGAALDPDPAVGPYTYHFAKFNHMWVGHYVYLSPLAGAATASLSADWELTPSGALYVGYATGQYPAMPPGYSGPTVPMPTNPPPPPPPVRPPKPAPKLPPPPKPTATPRPTATLRPRATPVPYATPGPALADPPDPACAPVSCALKAMTTGPTVFIMLLLLVLVAGASLLAPSLFPALRARRGRRGLAVVPASTAAAPLLPTIPEVVARIGSEAGADERGGAVGASSPEAAGDALAMMAESPNGSAADSAKSDPEPEATAVAPDEPAPEMTPSALPEIAADAASDTSDTSDASDASEASEDAEDSPPA